jgi:hypothetical protein
MGGASPRTTSRLAMLACIVATDGLFSGTGGGVGDGGTATGAAGCGASGSACAGAAAATAGLAMGGLGLSDGLTYGDDGRGGTTGCAACAGAG